MPHYDYACSAGHEFTAFQPITADPLDRCPDHADASVRRLIGAGCGIIFKGSGFYATDYKKPAGGSKGGTL